MARKKSTQPITGNILIADDDMYCRHMLTQYLDRYGNVIWEAPDGQEAYEVLTNENLDLCILDYHLPGLSASELISKVHEKNSDFPFVIVTGDGAPETEKNARQLSPAFYLVKPLNLDDVRAVIERVIANKRSALTAVEAMQQ